jgi:lipopolysaccharide/colanic/teichoic acid biosynthesis glycosyltransferase
MKRLFDFVAALGGLIILLPILVLTMVLIWLQDFHSPLYLAPRVRRRDQKFGMVKLRSMVVNADQVGGSSTAGTDKRITSIGRLIRKFKLDEFSQLWNVMVGDMSFVGPRPQEPEHCNRFYTEEEFGLFEGRPGMTDFSSIVFSDEGDILAECDDPDLKYNQIIRPWKSRLGLFYLQSNSMWVDLQLIILTVVSIISRPMALRGVQSLLKKLGASKSLVEIAGRSVPLTPSPPPGADVVETRC